MDKRRAILSGAGAVTGRGGPKTINETAGGKNHFPRFSGNFATQSALTRLRLVRVRIGNFWLGDLAAGQWRVLMAEECKLINLSQMKHGFLKLFKMDDRGKWGLNSFA